MFTRFVYLAFGCLLLTRAYGQSDTLKEWEKKFTAFQFKSFEENGHFLPYRLYAPPHPVKGKQYPLVVFFHGAGERGNDNRYQFFRFNPVAFWETNPCYVLAPQCPSRLASGSDSGAVWVLTPFGAPSHSMRKEPQWPLQLAMEVLDKTVAENSIDKDRIYVTGLSMGGFATWEIIQREPQKFAAAIPVCGGGDPAYADRLNKMPLWVFHGSADSTVLPQRSRDMVAAIKKAGGNVIYTEYPGVGHGSWSKVYPDQAIWDWLFEQRKK